MVETEAEFQFRNRLRSGARRVRGSGLKVAPNCRCAAPARRRDCRYSNQLHRGVLRLEPNACTGSEVAGTGAARARAVRRRAGRLDRQRRAAVDRPRPPVLPGEPVLGRQRLHPHLRRLPAAGRPHGRPAGPPPPVHGRHRPVRHRVAARRLRGERGTADRRPRAAGPRRRAALARRPVARDRDLQGGRGAQQGARRLGRRGRLRRRRRRAARRHADRVGRLGVGPVRQRPDRRGRRDAGPAPAAREPQRRRAPLRRRRRRLGDGRPLAAGLLARRRAQRGLGLDADDRPDRAVARADRGLRGRSSSTAGRRWSPSRASSGTGRSPAST